MRKNGNIDLEFLDLFADEADPHLLPEEGERDAFVKILEIAELESCGVDTDALDAQTAHIHKRIDSHYQKLAQAVTSPPEAQVTNDPQLLQKRFSRPDPKACYREFYKVRQAKGMSASDALEEWLTMFPHRNPDVELLMVEVSKEFS